MIWLHHLCHITMTATVSEPLYKSEEFILILKPEFKSMKTVLFTDVTVYEDITIMKVLSKIVDWFSAVWKNSDKFVNLFINNWMQISLKSNWNNKMFRKARIYSLSLRDHEIVNKTFNELQKQNCIVWTAWKMLFSYSVFVIWKTLKNDTQKSWIMMNI